MDLLRRTRRRDFSVGDRRKVFKMTDISWSKYHRRVVVLGMCKAVEREVTRREGRGRAPVSIKVR